MRIPTLLMCVLLICGCVKDKGPEAVEMPQTVYLTENFSGGLGDWTVKGTGGGAMEVVEHPNLQVERALEMRSQMLRSAMAESPNFTMEWDRDYVVSFNYMLRHRDNFGYIVYRDRNVELELGEGSALVCIEGERKTLVGRFDTNVWNKVVIKVRPQEGDYDVLFGRDFKRSCDIRKSQTAGFSFGDPDPSDTVYGDGLWDDFRVTNKL